MQPRHRASGKEWSRKWGNGGRTGTGSGPQALRPQYTALVYITNHGAWPRVSKASQESRPGPALAYRREGERLGSRETRFASWPQPDRNPQENAPLPLHALPPASWALSHKPCALASPSHHPPNPSLRGLQTPSSGSLLPGCPPHLLTQLVFRYSQVTVFPAGTLEAIALYSRRLGPPT